MVSINWTLSALDDVENIAAYIAKDSPFYASLTVSSFFDTVDILATNPNAGRVVPEFNQLNIRELINGSYRIIYKIVNDNQVDIITIHHANRLISNNKNLKFNDK
jgi:toxin ParE1/3/4